MILFPAIDLKEGACVRLVKGEMSQATIFNTDPAAQAMSFENSGAMWIHVVDLDGAFAGKPMNREAIRAILSHVHVPVQLGGGIRDMKTIEAWLYAGIERVVLGTVALRNPDLVKEACKRFPGYIAVGIDARGGKVAVEGWAETSDMNALDLALRFEDAGVDSIIHTDIDRDGVLQGPNIEATAALAERLSMPVVASGGISTQDDLIALSKRKISGAIVGRALYDGRIDLAAAIEALRPSEDLGEEE